MRTAAAEGINPSRRRCLRVLACAWLFGPAALAAAAGAAPAPVQATPLPAPQGRPLLRVRGAISVHNTAEGAAAFDRTQIDALPVETIRTRTPWTDGVVAFEGPMLTDVLARVGAEGRMLELTALNGYVAQVPVEDAERYRPVLALRADGHTLGVRERGPLWLIYPWDDFAELRTESIYRRAVWQLSEIVVEP
ncbi:hypothetical protein EV699_111163 [Plasticicumulans lactativorans]|uniref:Oxidoreductase molybdopterin-binding domain-containing protein n=1 Tax=Plasticicumulans lactativorans TaxID=1133106 RepID=A0A4R2L596_9GAMM|nr:hypothetical protein [Plasticicumulans lactativorans]TCO80962.1 hypothetical protein EV699_111163 [Plasticicumulans lactativorans]